MIFATIGTQLPFDRLIQPLDKWAKENSKVELFAQIGAGKFVPQHLNWTRDLDPRAFKSQMERCDIVVAHAGMGSIITALELGKKVIIMPRQAQYGEHRNDHQLATAARLEHLNGLTVVQDANELSAELSRPVLEHDHISVSGPKPELIRAIRNFAGLEAA